MISSISAINNCFIQIGSQMKKFCQVGDPLTKLIQKMYTKILPKITILREQSSYLIKYNVWPSQRVTQKSSY